MRLSTFFNSLKFGAPRLDVGERRQGASTSEGHGKRALAGLAVLGLGLGALAGCTTDQLSAGIDNLRSDSTAGSETATMSPAQPDSAQSGEGQEAPRPSPSEMMEPAQPPAPTQVPQPWQDAIAQVEAQFGGSAGIAVAMRGGDVAEFGSLLSDVAWSTSKVPVAVAVVREQGVTPEVVSAITVSDNAAAEMMWASLGDPFTAGQKVDQVLRDGGDFTTVMQTERVRPEFTAFGQTQWALRDQAVFGANMRCISGGGEVSELMGQISAGQGYGLGSIPGALFKGGWGPDMSGMYLTRQFGVVPGVAPGEYVGVAVAVRSADGTYETEQAMLTSIASAIAVNPIAGAGC